MTGKPVKICAAMVFAGAAMVVSAGPAAAADHVVEWRGVVVTVSGADSEVVHVRTPFGLHGQASYTYIDRNGRQQYGWADAHFPIGLDATAVVPGRVTGVSACVARSSEFFQETFSAKPPGWSCSPRQAL
ncbi:hypothetical protein ACWCPQ_22080 [Nocardia sp. NPDC001965]